MLKPIKIGVQNQQLVGERDTKAMINIVRTSLSHFLNADCTIQAVFLGYR